MLTPILRLLAIYLAVALAVFAFFNRDRVAAYMGQESPEPEVAVVKATPEPVAELQTQPAPEVETATPVFAPPPGENGVPDAPEPGSEPAQPRPDMSRPALQTPKAPTTAPGSGLQPPTVPTAPATPAPQDPDQPPSGQTSEPTATAGSTESGTVLAPAGGLQTPTPASATAPASAMAPAAPVQPDATSGPDTFEAGLAHARALYWQNDVNGAIASYRELLAQYPDSETLHGELGNIYYMNGQRIEAAEQFEAAAMAALATGNRQQAQTLLGVLTSLDRSAASRLQGALEDTQ